MGKVLSIDNKSSQSVSSRTKDSMKYINGYGKVYRSKATIQFQKKEIKTIVSETSIYVIRRNFNITFCQ